MIDSDNCDCSLGIFFGEIIDFDDVISNPGLVRLLLAEKKIIGPRYKAKAALWSTKSYEEVRRPGAMTQVSVFNFQKMPVHVKTQKSISSWAK